jgi:hypothetical protein
VTAESALRVRQLEQLRARRPEPPREVLGTWHLTRGGPDELAAGRGSLRSGGEDIYSSRSSAPGWGLSSDAYGGSGVALVDGERPGSSVFTRWVCFLPALSPGVFWVFPILPKAEARL